MGNFTFTIDQYKASGTYITEQMKQDSFYAARLAAKFVPSQARAIAKAMEVKILGTGPAAQTAANRNLINGAAHRMVGSGASATIGVKDFALAKYALQKANVPMTNLIAMVDPSVEFTLSTQTNLTSIAYNPKWEGIVRDGMSTGTQFKFNIYGFDVYTSVNLPVSTASETVNSVVAATGSVSNLFFSAAPDVLPFVGLIRQQPKVDSEYEKDYQREEYVTTCRYGFKLYRPENMVVVLTDPAQVS